MKAKRSLQNQIRGWLPKEPTICIIKSTGDKKKLDNWILCAFSVPGALMIVAALLSVNFGLTLVTTYLPESLKGADTVYYSGLYGGILSLGAFVLELFSGALLLTKKHTAIAVTSMIVILSFGLATIVIPPTLDGLSWQSGLIVASPMVAFTVTSLIIVGINYNKLKKINIDEEKPQSWPPTALKPLAIGLGALGFGLTLIGTISQFGNPYSQTSICNLLVFGVSLLVAAFLVRRTYKHYESQEQS